MSLVWTEWLNVGGDRSWGSCKKTETQGRRRKTPSDCVSCYRRPLPSRPPLCPEQKHYTMQLLTASHSEPCSIGIIFKPLGTGSETAAFFLLLLSQVAVPQQSCLQLTIAEIQNVPCMFNLSHNCVWALLRETSVEILLFFFKSFIPPFLTVMVEFI